MKLSIITINYNNAEGLEKTIQSVINQNFKDFEYIVIDGGSSDRSVSIIENYTNNFSYWVSESDTGVYNAMNKGIAKACGEYLLMLNSGDYFVNNDVVKNVFSNEITADIIYGDLVWSEANGTYDGCFPFKLTFDFFRKNSLGHQAAFIKRTLHSLVGIYDEQLAITSDWKFFVLAICKYNISYKHIPIFISVCSRDGISCKPENLAVIKNEKDLVLKKEFPAFIDDYNQLDTIQNYFNKEKNNILSKIKKKLNNVFSLK